MRFGRRSRKEDEDRQVDVEQIAAEPRPVAGTPPTGAEVRPRASGPWDVAELDVSDDDSTYIDLGAMIVKGRIGFDLQVPTDPDTGEAGSIVLVTEASAVELRAFAAARSGGLWDEVRAEIVEEVAGLQGVAEEVAGPFGPELLVQVPVETPDGQQGVQPSRIIGVDGPRWLLRATFLGLAALEPDSDEMREAAAQDNEVVERVLSDRTTLERAVRDLVVVRGTSPMAPREPIPVVLPEGAVRIDDEGEADLDADDDGS